MATQKPDITEYKGYLIVNLQLDEPFLSLQDYSQIAGFGLVYLVENKEITTYFAFAYKTKTQLTKEQEKLFKTSAGERIKQAIDNQTVKNFQWYTFEFRNNTFEQVTSPAWWEGMKSDYSFYSSSW
jgi:hypothetical protein